VWGIWVFLYDLLIHSFAYSFIHLLILSFDLFIYVARRQPLIALCRKKNPVALQPYRALADRAAAAGQRSQCQLLRIEGCHVVSATDSHGIVP
jgi:hypothetical protein